MNQTETKPPSQNPPIRTLVTLNPPKLTLNKKKETINQPKLHKQNPQSNQTQKQHTPETKPQTQAPTGETTNLGKEDTKPNGKPARVPKKPVSEIKTQKTIKDMFSNDQTP